MTDYKEKIQQIVDGITAKTFETPGEAVHSYNRILEIVQHIPRDPTTEKGRKEIKAIARSIASARIAVDKIGKDHKAELTRIGKVIDAERNAFKNPMESLQVRILEPVTALERKEAERVEEHKDHIEQIKALRDIPYDASLDGINERIKRLSSLMQRDYEEFSDLANAENDVSQSTLYQALGVAETREQEEKEARDREITNAVKAAQEQLEEQRKRDVAEANSRADRAAEQERARIHRQEEQRKQNDLRRQQNQEHRKEINRAALDGLMEQGFSEIDGKKIIIAIANGKIPHVTVNY